MAKLEFEKKITQARLALAWEGIWAALCWPLVISMAASALVISGGLALLPDLARYAVLLGFAGVLLWSLRTVLTFRWPTSYDAMRRVEAKSNLANRPISTSKDTLADEAWDDESRALWEEHKQRQLAALKDLKAGTPRSAWQKIDGMSLRVPAAMALIASLFLAQGNGISNLTDALRIGPLTAQKTLSLDAWLKPPTYTGKPPLLLTSPAFVEKLKTENEIIVPENAGLALRLDGAKKPRIGFYDITGQKPEEIKDLAAKTKFENGLFEATAKLTRPSLIKVFDGDKELAAWHVALIPDEAPAITILGDPKGEGQGSLTVKWKATDDYGVATITSQIYLSDTQDDGLGFSNNGVFLFDPPSFPIALKKSQPREEVGSTKADLTAHQWAGLMVDLTLEVTDAAKHKTTSVVKTFRMPERVFIQPLAQALVEQRKTLILDPEQLQNVQKLLSAILVYPVGLIDRSGTHIAIASVISRLRNMHDQADLQEALDMLWQIAIIIEDGDVADARAAVEAARKALEKAIAEGASPEQLKQLMDKLRGAMDKYMESMKKEAEKRFAQGQKNQRDKNGKTITQQDIQKMLDEIEKLSQSGQKDAAKEMLAQLEDLLKNMQPGMAQQGDQQEQSEDGKMLDKLTDLMRKQQGLMDKTLRQPQPGEGDQQSPDAQEPGNGPGETGEPNQNGLAGEQGDLAKQLEQFMRDLEKNGIQGPPSFGEAGRQMGEAKKSLEQRNRDQALGQQGDALSKLREGAQKMARDMQQKGRSGQDSSGREGEAKGDPLDPLGRPMPTTRDDFGPDKNMLPSELAIRRAREILESLRARANTPDLPKIDKDYIERLLRGLY
jgi:uncharacterized protein (TIGR02302 family)